MLATATERERMSGLGTPQTELSQRWQQRGDALALGDLLEGLRSIDSYTYRHSLRMAELSFWLGRELGASNPFQLYEAALYHDVGKIAIPEEILIKPGPLTTEERAIVEFHVQATKQLLSDLGRPDLMGAADHHERLGGNGYPRRLVGEGIPLAGRIFAVADVFEAVTGVRPYRDAMPVEGALKLLQAGAGTDYDPTVVGALAKLLARTQVTVDGSSRELLEDLSRLESQVQPG